MKNSSFVHLHLHSSLSLLDGLGKVNEYAKKANELTFTHLAITDHGTVNGTIKFQRACEQHGIKPIIGCEIYLTEDATVKEKNNGHMVVLVKNEQGWQNLLKMLSYAHLKGFYYKPRISYETILNHHEGLIITSACAHSWVFQQNGRKLLCDLLERKSNEDIYLEIMPHNDKATIEANAKFIRLSNKFDIPLLATNDAHYVNKEDADAHEVLLAIQKGAKWNDKNRWKFSVKTLYLQSADEMIASFERQNSIDSKVYIRAMRNTLEVAMLCEDFKIEPKIPKLPKVKGIKKEDEEKRLRELCARGFVEKVGEFMSVDYENRIDYEIEVLREKKAIRYFLLVWDLVNWCRENDILCSSRGSVGCSLVAFLIGITEVDPIKYNLPFSRFLNEERIDLPDIDLDLPDNKRNLVTARLHGLYGENNVAGISTFNRMKARGVIRDVARVFEVAINEVDWFAKLIDSSIEDAMETDEGEEFARRYPQIIKYAKALENTEKSLGRHAAGKIISSEDLTVGTRAYLCMREDELTINWEGEDCEHQGLVKLDILGLNYLTIIAETINLVKKNYDKVINFFKIPIKDPLIYQELSGGRFAGVFQMGYAVRNLVQEMGVSDIEEWSDAIALARPGPLDSGMTEEYIKRKQSGKWEKKHELYEEILKETFGVVCYQEQVMNIIHKVAGLSYATADKIRKVIGKKRDVKEFEPYRKEFIRGCLKNQTLSQDEAEEFWEGLLKHSRYSFNMSHALSYAILGYKCLWLLHYFPLEFICAALSYGTDKIKEEMLDEAQKINIKIVPPKYGISAPKEWIVKNQKLYAPYVMIKGIGEKLAEEIKFEPVKKKKGFFLVSNNTELKPKVRTILEAINAFNLDIDDLPDEAGVYFDIDFGKYTPHEGLFIQKQDPYEINEDLFECSSCELCNECERPVPPSPSKYNLMIVGEAPGKDEDKIGKGFTGKAGKLLWEELLKHKLLRSHFHVSNVVKCFPSKQRNPSEKQVNICSKWLDEEINFVKPAIILALGNMAMYQLKGLSKGIMRMNSNIEWNSKYGSFVLYSVHPALILRSPNYHDMFSKSIETLANKIKELSK